jgi:sulfite reductase (NADPH) flavoprotein alpha-component
MTKSAIKAALLQIHSIVGLVTALLLSVIALTGVIMSFEDEIQASLNAGISHVAARPGPPLAPDQLIARLRTDHHDDRIAAISLSSDPTAAVRIRFAPGKGGSRPASIFVDPYDAHVLGTPRGEDFFATVRRLHRWLLIPGDAKGYGRQITGIAAISLIMMLISGLVLRWPYRARNVKTWLKPNLGLRGRGLHRSLHAVVGTWVLPIYLVMTLTGLWYSFDWYKTSVVWLLSPSPGADGQLEPRAPRSARAAQADIKPGDPKLDSKPLALDAVWSALQRVEGDRFRTVLMNLPAGTGTIVRVRAWPDDRTEGPHDEFRIDAANGEIVASDIYADKTVGERILMRILDIHRGSVLGWPGKLAFMLAAAAMPLFVVTGLLLYLSRRRHSRLARLAEMRLVPGE